MRSMIYANDIIEAVDRHTLGYSNQLGDDITCILEEVPTVEAVPVVHGKWIFGQSNHHEWMKCSECLHSYDVTGTFSYCPNCGADMIERKENERD